MSIGKVAEGLIGRRAKSLFHIIIFFLIALAMGVFVDVVATLFSPDFYPESVLPTSSLMFIAIIMGLLVYKASWPLARVTAGGFVLMLLFVYLGIGIISFVYGLVLFALLLIESPRKSKTKPLSREFISIGSDVEMPTPKGDQEPSSS